MNNQDDHSRNVQSALERLTLEETVALTLEFERILASGVCDPVRQQDTTKKKKRELVDKNGDILCVGQKVETTANGKRVVGKIKRIGKRVTIEARNRPLIVRAFHNVRIVERKK